jgi:hypothetical protein
LSEGDSHNNKIPQAVDLSLLPNLCEIPISRILVLMADLLMIKEGPALMSKPDDSRTTARSF